MTSPAYSVRDTHHGIRALHRGARVGVFSGVLLRSPFPEALLGVGSVLPYPHDAQAGELDAVMGWGLKPGAENARAYARRHGLPFFRSEDAFLRSVGLGVQGEGPLGICLDDVGMYYDARAPSRLEALIASAGGLDQTGVRRARACIEAIREHGLSKYNWWPTEQPPWRDDRERVLVVDQTAGDLSIGHGRADAESFERMVDDALSAHPDAEVVVKVHPDVLSGHKQGHLEHLSGEPRVRLVAEPINPMRLLERVSAVYVVTSQLGFEALMAGREVHCYGLPFYAGWGLTRDRVQAPRRTVARSLEQVFHAAYVQYARYVQPETGESTSVEGAIEFLAEQRARQARNAGRWAYRSVPMRQRRALRDASDAPRSSARFIPRKAPLAPDERGADWLPSCSQLLRPPGRLDSASPAPVAPGPLDALVPPRWPLPPSFVRGMPSEMTALRRAETGASTDSLAEAREVLRLLDRAGIATSARHRADELFGQLLRGESAALDPHHPLATFLDRSGRCLEGRRADLVALLLVDWPLYTSLRTGRPCSCLTTLRERMLGVPRVLGLAGPPPE